MPEGDTLFRAARRVGAGLTGQTVRAFRSTLGPRIDEGRVGKRIDKVESRGKNLLVYFEDGWTLHTHLRMRGAWRVFARGELDALRPPHTARVVIEAGDVVCVCFLAPVVRLLRGDGDRELALGPDLLGEPFDMKVAVASLRSAGDVPIGESIMIQRLVSGIGNVFKSEVLFLEALDPWAPTSSLDDDALERLLSRARTLMRRNVLPGAGMRVTRPGGRFWAYGRSGQPCFKCGARIRMRRQGQGRSTYFCPACQHVAREGRPPA